MEFETFLESKDSAIVKATIKSLKARKFNDKDQAYIDLIVDTLEQYLKK